MKIWLIFYCVALLYNAFDGFHSLLPSNGELIDTSWAGIATNFLIMMLAPVVLVVMLNFILKPSYFDWPSWDLPLYKPLQFIGFMIPFAAAAAFGAALALPYTNALGVMNFYRDCVLVTAVFLANCIVHYVYRNKIRTAPREIPI